MLSGLAAQAQQTVDEAYTAYQQKVGDYAALYRGRLLTANYNTGWATHPFYGNDQFHEGEICFRGVIYKQVLMRLNVRDQQLEICSPHTDNVLIIDQTGIDWFAFDGMRFVPCQQGFVHQLYAGRYIRIEHHITKVKDHDVQYNNVALSNLKQQESLTLHTTDGDYPVSNLKSMQKLFPQCKQQLAEYSKAHGLKYNKANRQTSLAALAEVVEQHLAQRQGSQSEGEVAITKKHKVLSPLVVQSLPSSDPTILNIPVSDEVELSSTITLPAYQAYREGNDDRPVFAEDAAAAKRQAGISDLKPVKEERTLDEVVVTSFYSKVDQLQVGAEKFRPAMLRNLPMSMGESDVMKMVQTLPGVSTIGEASSGFNVRGGASDQNLILLGSNTIYNPMHMFGLFSAFNTDAIGEIELYKSSVPSQYGGRASSVMYMQNRAASKQKFGGSVSAGILTSKAQLDIPLIKDKLSLMLAGRATYSDWMLKKLPEKSGYRNGNAGFYDMNAGLSWNVNARHVVNVNGYYSHDRFSFSGNDKYGYNNANAALEWKGYWNDRFTSTIQAGFDHYDYLRDDVEVEYSASHLTFGINQGFFKGLFAQTLNDKHTLKFGWDATFYDVQPGQIQPYDEWSNIAADTLQRQRALMAALFAEDEWRLTDNIRLTGGVRYNLFTSFQKGLEHTYQSPELRLGASYSLPHHQSVKFGVSNLTQFIHKVSNTVIMSPTDTWTLSNDRIKPQRGWQVTGGYYWRTEDSQYEVSAEAYYKRLSSYPTYGNAALLVMNHALPDDLVEAQGKAFGAELQLKKTTGKLTGWISYAFARTFLRQNNVEALDAINRGEWYPAEYDHPHELNVVTNYKFTKRYSMSVNLDYSTGRPTTVPAGKYYDYKRGEYLPYYTDRNGYRQPDNFRMDVSFNIEPSHHQTLLTHWWITIGCYNVTAHRNVYSLYYKSHGSTIQGYRLSIFGAPIPYLSFNIKF